ncbi:MAG: hypothetical protein JW801_12620, partial [Bacteroidales bacterium]|nr:hypothetical protein [Bacteroidales bacterium]MBN2862639.1 hypothetical protein [Bacteroidales bacterium]
LVILNLAPGGHFLNTGVFIKPPEHLGKPVNFTASDKAQWNKKLTWGLIYQRQLKSMLLV